jgi:hypothetical protein
MNRRNDARNLHDCRNCVSLQYGSGNLAADCIRKGKRIRSRQADDATFFAIAVFVITLRSPSQPALVCPHRAPDWLRNSRAV